MVPSRETARQVISDGRVTVDGAPALNPARQVSPSENIEILEPPAQFVSRAGNKLEGALEAFDLAPAGLVCLDAGSSTGGFTDCLLQHGAAKVYAVDIGTNQLHEKIRQHASVVSHEKTDIRVVDRTVFDEPLQLIVGDLSFISLRLVLPSLASLIEPGTSMILLVKPQFEASQQEAAKGNGVIDDPDIWLRALTEVVEAAAALGAEFVDGTVSPIRGRTGNVEFVVHLRLTAVTNIGYSQQRLAEVVAEAQTNPGE